MSSRVPSLAILVAIVALTFQSSGRATNNNQWGCAKYADYQIGLYNGGTAEYWDIIWDEGINESSSWNQFTSVQFLPTSAGATDAARAYNGYYGSTGWAGLASIVSVNWETCILKVGKAEINQTYTDGYPTSYKKQVACHELGHLVGLKHDTTTPGTCMTTPVNGTHTISTHDRSMITATFGSLPSTCSSCPRITLLTNFNGFIFANNAGGSSVYTNGNPSPSQYTVFRLVDLGGSQVALQADNGQYFAAEGGGGGVVNANRNSIGAWETFTKIDLGGGYVAFQADNGQYLVAEDNNNILKANRDSIGAWETFLLDYQ